jgi:DNA repair exonuclease SbcCD ATPase subunit
MASESSSERTLSVSLPADLEEWLDEQATAAEVDREELLVQLLTTYRQTAEESADALEVDSHDIEEAVRTQLDDQLDARIEQAVADVVTDQLSEATNSVQRQLSNRIDTVESEFDEKITDVRERVIQVKKEADSKAPAEHSHDELEAVPELEATVTELQTELDELRTEFDEQVPDHDEALADAEGRLDEMQDRLQTVAWVVSDLREAQESGGGLQAVERIKRAAAKADIERANCENCGEGVTLALLTDPECPHCSATVTNVEPASGWFGNPKLLTAAQLESGERS